MLRSFCNDCQNKHLKHNWQSQSGLEVVQFCTPVTQHPPVMNGCCVTGVQKWTTRSKKR